MSLASYIKQVIWISPDSTIDKAMVMMDRFKIHHLPVAHDSEVVGMISDRDVLLGVGWQTTQQRAAGSVQGQVRGPTCIKEIMTQPVHTLAAGDTVRSAVQIMAHHKISAVPLTQDGVLSGIITERDVLQRIRDDLPKSDAGASFLARKLDQVMTTDVKSVKPTSSLSEIIMLFKELRIRHVPVKSGERVTGIISDRDLLRAVGVSQTKVPNAPSGAYQSKQHTAMSIMTHSVHTVSADQPMSEAVAALLTHRIHCLPVVNGGNLAGIITETDILRAFCTEESLFQFELKS